MAKRDKPAKEGHNSGSIAKEKLRSVVERIERLQTEKQAIQGDISDIFGEAKSAGFDCTVIRQVLKIRRLEREEYEERKALEEVYLDTLDGTEGL